MTGREPAHIIDDDAAAWAARIDRGLDEGERTALGAWLGDDTRRMGALARAQAIWLHGKHASSLAPLMALPAAETSVPPAGLLSRRGALFGGGALAAGLVGAVALPRLLGGETRLRTGIGEIRRVPLGDGSVVTLDTDSLLEVAFSRAARTVRLLSGGAFFEVAADAVRPFLVETRDVVLRAAVSAFSVRAIAGLPLAVVVSLGRVALLGPTGRPTLDIATDTRATFAAGAVASAAPMLEALAPGEVDRALSWRGGMLAFEGETLAEAAATFRRYGQPFIEIADPDLARRPITGLFTANDPAGFARATALSLDARTESAGDVIKLTPLRRT